MAIRQRLSKIRRSIAQLYRQEEGAGTAFLVLGTMGLLLSGAFVVDTINATGDAAQIKRATDAAAWAIGNQVVVSHTENQTFDEQDMAELAYQYVAHNLGMNTKLSSQITRENVTVVRGEDDGAKQTYTVSVSFNSAPDLLKFNSVMQEILSQAEVRTASLEVALAIPNTLTENGANMAALRRMGNSFAQALVNSNDNAWLSLVPYSQSVNVYDPDHTNRIREWGQPGALNPIELTTLFQAGYGSLADRRMPDRRYNRLCLFRGLDRKDNYFWDEAPGGQFGIYYRHDLPVNSSINYNISWVGPNPMFGQAGGVNDTRFLIVDHGCPVAPLLPLSNDLNKISERLSEMTAGFNVNFAIAMGWAAMALAPNFRGEEGWGLPDSLPKDFSEGKSDRVKAIVLLVNSTDMRWFDSDGYNAYNGQAVDGCQGETDGCNDETLITQRFADLCDSFRARDLRFFLIVTGTDDAEDEDGQVPSASAFRRIAGTGLNKCAVKSSDLSYFNGANFVESENKMTERLASIVEELQQQSSFVRLVK
ncbi:Tad domain-containing protein [Klebsiella sp. BIGb0407]|uniref:Tad domain-containing protein n=1 Tax=Klebsiella sp. BIGb0407 TaxID=2940603 RepID=UPI00216A2291|nr:Tad domain-containing protein [Klebsiella sp. BIGb0407]MCS3430169.1 Flp pilus assembly protein TadG [Klebsiella sp. BIGb0407]